jgi:hypothetical protein
VDGNVTLGNLNYGEAISFLQTKYLASDTINCVPSISYLASQTEETRNGKKTKKKKKKKK